MFGVSKATLGNVSLSHTSRGGVNFQRRCVAKVRRLKDRTNKAVSNGEKQGDTQQVLQQDRVGVERRVVGGTKEQRGRPSFYKR